MAATACHLSRTPHQADSCPSPGVSRPLQYLSSAPLQPSKPRRSFTAPARQQGQCGAAVAAGGVWAWWARSFLTGPWLVPGLLLAGWIPLPSVQVSRSRGALVSVPRPPRSAVCLFSLLGECATLPSVGCGFAPGRWWPVLPGRQLVLW